MADAENKYLDSERKIDEGFVVLISRISILMLMAEGFEERGKMALTEIGNQLDQQARQLLDEWEMYSTRLHKSPNKTPESGTD